MQLQESLPRLVATEAGEKNDYICMRDGDREFFSYATRGNLTCGAIILEKIFVAIRGVVCYVLHGSSASSFRRRLIPPEGFRG
jgi:hypothetical protein